MRRILLISALLLTTACGARPAPLTGAAPTSPAGPVATAPTAPERVAAATPAAAASPAGSSTSRHKPSESRPAPGAGGYVSWNQPQPEPQVDISGESYAHTPENPYIRVQDDPLSTFSIDVDTASYSNVRRYLTDGSAPPPGAVRIEELVNYFTYDYPEPQGDEPFSVTLEVAQSPWAPDRKLALIGLQGRHMPQAEAKPRNLVFLVDVSGSMQDDDKLPLLKRGLRRLVSQVREQDRVSMVVYAGSSGLVLEPTADRDRIEAALDRLEAGGSTNGAGGIVQAYEVARSTFRKGGVNRVILCTDGDFNVGVSSEDQLVRLVEKERKSGVFLTVLGFGTGNLQDSKMEALADHGNGQYCYIDSEREAEKVLVEQAGSTLETIAKDVKIQVEFNPAEVAEYRLVGYENRMLAHQDFNDDRKDAGEIGAGHSVTALYEIVPASQGDTSGKVDPLRYQEDGRHTSAALSGELLTVKLRYKEPDGTKSRLTARTLRNGGHRLEEASESLRFAAAVASFGMLLRDSDHKANVTYDQVLRLAKGSLGQDPQGQRREFLRLVEQARGVALR